MRQQLEEAKCHQPRIENVEHGVNHIQIIEDDDNTDDKIAVDDYLVQNIK